MGVAAQVWELAGEQGVLESKIEGRIINNRFAAKLLMLAKEFRKTFWGHMSGDQCNINQELVCATE